MDQRNIKHRGLFIAFEGPDGSGKTTQARLLAEYLQQRGTEYIAVGEPGGTPAGNAIRSLLLDPGTVLTSLGEAMLFATARAQLVQDVIMPALTRGAWVVSDRYVFSSLAYQGYGLGLDLDFLRDINFRAVQKLLPDMTFVLDADPLVGITRQELQRGLDRIELRDQAFHLRVREGYRQLAAQYNLQLLSGSRDIDKTHLAICKLVENLSRGGAQT